MIMYSNILLEMAYILSANVFVIFKISYNSCNCAITEENTQ